MFEQNILPDSLKRSGWRCNILDYDAVTVALGAELFLAPMSFIVIICLIVAVSSARFANRCDILKLNRVIGIVLLILGIFTIFTKYYL